MATETSDDQGAEQSQERDAAKFQQAMFLRYRPQSGRADRSPSNIPGGTSAWGGNGAHTIGHGGSN
jgi:hypothetical protein